jgi:hypothetical protein
LWCKFTTYPSSKFKTQAGQIIDTIFIQAGQVHVIGTIFKQVGQINGIIFMQASHRQTLLCWILKGSIFSSEQLPWTNLNFNFCDASSRLIQAQSSRHWCLSVFLNSGQFSLLKIPRSFFTQIVFTIYLGTK